MTLAGFYKHWQNFFFKPTSPTPIALFRICLGLIVLQDLLLMLIPDFNVYYSDNAIIPIDQISANWWHTDPCFDLMLLLPGGDSGRLVFLWLTVGLAVLMTVGLWTRFSSVALFLCMLSIDNHFELNQNDGDVFIRLAVMMVAMSNCGDAFSFDNLIRALGQDWRVEGLAPRLSAPWAQRLLQMQVAFVYFHSFISKIAGRQWLDGVACYYASRYDEMFRFPVPFLFENLWMCKLLTWFTLITEFLLFTLIWFKETRYWVIFLGMILHLGIEYSTNLPLFEWLFMSLYLLFVDPKDLTRAMDWTKAKIAARFGPPSVVAYDGDCGVCVRVVGLIYRLDIFGRLQFLSFRSADDAAQLGAFDWARAEREMLLQVKDGWQGGFYAFRSVAWLLPLLWWLCPLLYIPGINYLGERVYAWVSENRFMILGRICEGGVCSQ